MAPRSSRHADEAAFRGRRHFADIIALDDIIKGDFKLAAAWEDEYSAIA